MRSRQPESTDPAFLNEKDARKQAERQLLLDALSGDVQAAPIEWAPGSTAAIAPALLVTPRQSIDQEPSATTTGDPEAAAERQNRS